MNFPELKAVIFDMDGVLVDSEPLHLIAFQEFFKRFEIAYSAEDNREFLGRKDLQESDNGLSLVSDFVSNDLS